MLTDPTAGLGYAFGEVLTSADMNVIVGELPNAIDGVGGGAYTLNPATLLTLTGANLKGALLVGPDYIGIGGLTSIGGATAPTGTAGQHKTNVGGTTTFVNLASLNMGSGSALFALSGSAAVIDDGALFQVQSAAAVNVFCTAWTWGSASVQLNSGKIINSGAGRTIKRASVQLNSAANSTIAIGTAEKFWSDTDPAADRTVTISSSGAEEGDELLVTTVSREGYDNFSAWAHKYIIQRADLTPLGMVSHTQATGAHSLWILYEFRGGVWTALDAGPNF